MARSTGVTTISIGAPARPMPTLTAAHVGRSSAASTRSQAVAICLMPTRTTTSPFFTPAASAGPPGSTSATTAPPLCGTSAGSRPSVPRPQYVETRGARSVVTFEHASAAAATRTAAIERTCTRELWHAPRRVWRTGTLACPPAPRRGTGKSACPPQFNADDRRAPGGVDPRGKKLAVPPISNFYVGVVALGTSGNIYYGANYEFPGEALSFTVHAEQAAVVNAMAHGETGLQTIAVSAAPCGYCRQFLNELTTASTLQILMPDREPMLLSSLLPAAFGPTD